MLSQVMNLTGFRQSDNEPEARSFRHNNNGGKRFVLGQVRYI